MTNGNASLRQLVNREIAKQILRKYIRRKRARKELNPSTLHVVKVLRENGVVFNLAGID